MRIRQGVAAVLAVLACLVLPVAVVSVWTAERVTGTEGYVAAVSPLADDPVVRREVAARLVVLVTSAVRSGGFGEQVEALAAPVVEQAAADVVAGELFQRVWDEASRQAHEQLLLALRTGETSPVTVELAPLLERALRAVEAAGVPRTALPALDTSFTLVAGEDLGRAREGYRAVDAAGVRAPAAWGALVLLALVVAVSRGRTLGLLALGSVVTAALGWALVVLARDPVVASTPRDDRALAGAVWDVVTASLERTLLVVVALAAVLAAARGLARVAGGLRARSS